MLIKAIELENIRSYEAERIDFQKGLVLLSGDIGCGKTSALLALEFALFGTHTDQLSGESLLRKGAAKGSVKVELVIEKQMIALFRSLKRTKQGVAQGTGYIEKEGTRNEYTAVEMKAKVLELLGYPLGLMGTKKNYIYRSTVYCPQEEMKNILAESPESRLTILRKIFDVDKYQVIRENASIFGGHLKTNARIEFSKCDGVETFQDQLQSLLQEKVFVEQQLGDAQRKINSITMQFEKADAELKQAKSRKEQRQNIELAARECNGKLQALLKQHEQLINQQQKISEKLSTDIDFKDAELYPQKEAEVLQLEQQQAIAVRTVEMYQKQQQDYLRQEQEIITILTTEQEMTQSLIEQIKMIEQTQLLEQEIVSLDDSLIKNRSVMGEMRALASRSSMLLTRIAALDHCPTCLQLVSPVHRESITTDERKKQQEYEQKLNECLAECSKIEQKRPELAAMLQQRQQAKTKVALLQQNLNIMQTKKKDLERLRHQGQKIQEEISVAKIQQIPHEVLQRHHNELKELKQKYELFKQHAFLQEQLKNMQVQLGVVDTQRKETLLLQQKYQYELESIGCVDLGPIEQHYNAIFKSLQQAILEEKTKSIEHKNIQSKQQELENQIRKMELSRVKYLQYQEIQHWFDAFFTPLTHTIEQHLFKRLHAVFSHHAQQWFSLLMEDQSMHVYIDPTFTPQIYAQGHMLEVMQLSGGERTAISLAYRLALNKAVNSLVGRIKTDKLIILDEPTEGFSSEQLDRMKQVFTHLGLEQVIIISHEQKIESYVEHIIRIVKENGISRVLE